jgi:hypothetical protein
MPTIPHEAPLELLRRDPRLAEVLVASLGVAVPPGATAQMVPADLTASLPAELRADAVVLLSGAGGKLAVITEVQLRYDKEKQFSWPAYVTQVRAAHRCGAVLLVICPHTGTAARCRETITTGHPGFDLAPLVIDSTTTPNPSGPGLESVGPELVVLAVLTGALDLGQDSARQLVLERLASLDEERLRTYTVFILNAARGPALRAMEALMTTKFTHPFIERLEAEGRAKGRAEGRAEGRVEGRAEGRAEGVAEGEVRGEARMILRVLAARGLTVPAEIRELVLSCADAGQLEAWGDRAATAATIDDVFGT